MSELTKKQRQIVEFIERTAHESGITPTFKEIAEHFGFRSHASVTNHLRLIRQKGALTSEPKQARSLRVVTAISKLRKRIVDIPIFGSIPAGSPQNREQEATGCVSIDVGTLGFKPTARTFALEVRGDSMTGKHIVDGDVVILEHGVTPKNGDVVAALIDNESTLKTFLLNRGKPFLRAENPKYPDLLPAQELMIQGVMVSLIRRRK